MAHGWICCKMKAGSNWFLQGRLARSSPPLAGFHPPLAVGFGSCAQEWAMGVQGTCLAPKISHLLLSMKSKRTWLKVADSAVGCWRASRKQPHVPWHALEGHLLPPGDVTCPPSPQRSTDTGLPPPLLHLRVPLASSTMAEHPFWLEGGGGQRWGPFNWQNSMKGQDTQFVCALASDSGTCGAQGNRSYCCC